MVSCMTIVDLAKKIEMNIIKKINKMVISYGFQILDLPQYEYGEYYAFSMGRMVAF